MSKERPIHITKHYRIPNDDKFVPIQLGALSHLFVRPYDEVVRGIQAGWLEITTYALRDAQRKGTPKISRIKQKLGELRIHDDNTSAETLKVYRHATELSRSICELSGKPGTLCYLDGTLKVLSREMYLRYIDLLKRSGEDVSSKRFVYNHQCAVPCIHDETTELA